MARVIHKTALMPGTVLKNWTSGGLLHFAADPKIPLAPCVWHFAGDREIHDLMVVATGQDIPDGEWRHFGTAPMPDGLVWHLLIIDRQPPF